MKNFCQLKGLLGGMVLRVAVLALAVGLMAAPSAKADSINLLTAGPANYSALGLGGPVSLASTTIVTNLGVFAPGGFTATSTSTVEGNLIKSTSINVPLGLVVDGSVISDDATIGQAVTDAIARSAYYNTLATNPLNITNHITTINSAMTLTGNGGLNVINLTGGLSLTSATLTLSGGASDAFVINVPSGDTFSLTGSAKILVTGGLLPQNVLFNVLGRSGTDTGDTIDGIILMPTGALNADGLIHGELIAKNLVLESGAIVQSPGGQVPIPPSAILFGSGLLGLGLLGGRKQWFRKS